MNQKNIAQWLEQLQILMGQVRYLQEQIYDAYEVVKQEDEWRAVPYHTDVRELIKNAKEKAA